MVVEVNVSTTDSRTASKVVVAKHYLHRRPPISHAFALHHEGSMVGVATYGTPASRHLQIGVCKSDPSKVIELNRLWVDDRMPRNTESWFVSRTLRMLPPKIVVSYADPLWGHYGYVYRALSFRYAGWTDMDRKTPRFDYVPIDPTKHTRDAFRTGVAYKRRRVAKVKYWTTTGTATDRKVLASMCGWPSYDWREMPPPEPDTSLIEVTA